MKAIGNFILSMIIAFFQFALFLVLSCIRTAGLLLFLLSFPVAMARPWYRKYFKETVRRFWDDSKEYYKFTIGGFIYCIPPLRRRLFRLLPKVMQKCITDKERHDVVNQNFPRWALQEQRKQHKD
jgi:hypothetical protein